MTTARAVIRAARGELGYHEGRSGGHWNNKEKYAADVPGLGWANYQPWCDTFVAWCFNAAGGLALLPGGPTASVAQSRDNWKKAGRFSEYPAVGAQVIFGTNGDAHTGIVVSYGDTTITTVEGNTNNDGSPEGDGVYLKTHQRTDPWVYGYGYPDYEDGIDSADPKWQARERTATAPKPAKKRPAKKPAPEKKDVVTRPECVDKNLRQSVHQLQDVHGKRRQRKAAAVIPFIKRARRKLRRAFPTIKEK